MNDRICDHTLNVLLDMEGVYVSPDGWWVKTEARRVPYSPERPSGVKYALTLHDRTGQRVLGYDNAHGYIKHRRVEWDHKHIRKRIESYHYENAAKLLEDFYADVEHWLAKEQ